MSGGSIVQVLANDIESIMPVMRAAFDPAYGESWSATQCTGVLALPGSRLVMAMRHGEAAGFALWRIVVDEAELLLIAVHPAQQGSGVGNQLLKHAVTESKESGAIRLHVEVRKDNPALHFYAKQGFVQVGRRPFYYKRSDGGSTDAMTLSLNL